MEIAIFIAPAMAGAVLKEVAKDTYGVVKRRLSDAFGLAQPSNFWKLNLVASWNRNFLAKSFWKAAQWKTRSFSTAPRRSRTNLQNVNPGPKRANAPVG